MKRRTFVELPDPVTGYALETFDVSVVKPRAAVNLVSNPSIETGTSGYTAVGGAIVQSTTKQRRGVFSLQVTPTAGLNDGVYYSAVTLTALTGYFMSVDFWGAAGVPYQLYFSSSGGVQLGAAYQFRGTGRWQRVWVYWQETATASRRLYITKDNHASTRPFYIDGLQCEADERTTYLDGSLRGFVRGQAAYYWTGAEHASPSVRVLATRSGGTEVKLRDLGLYVTAILGLGLNGIANITLPNAFAGGSQYQRTVQTEHTFDIAGTFMADSMQQLMSQRRDLIAALRPSAGLVQQPLLLKIQSLDDCGQPNGEPLEIECLYAGGLQGQRDNYFQEPVVLTFTQFLPYVARLDGTVGAELDFQDIIADSSGAVMRIDGVWQDIGGGFGTSANATVSQIAIDRERGRVYFVGDYEEAGGVYMGGVTWWDGTEFHNMDDGVNTVLGSAKGAQAIAIAPNGDVWVAGDFVTVGSAAATTSGLAKWDVVAETWTAYNITFGETLDNRYLLFDSEGNLYLIGRFTGWNGDADADRIVKYDGTTWTPLGTGLNDRAFAGALGPGDLVYVGGLNTTADGVTVNQIAYWDGTTFNAMAGGVSGGGQVTAILALSDGRILASYGGANTIGGVDANNIAAWNGTSWEPLGTGLGNEAQGLWQDASGFIYAVGAFISIPSLGFLDLSAGWNGSAWVPLDIVLEGFGQDVKGDHLGNVYIATVGDAANAATSGRTTVTNPGSADASPIITLTGPGRVRQISNRNTGDVLYFNLVLLAGETAVLDLTPGAIRFSSNFRPNLLGTILPGSTLATFRLAPGDNAVSVFITGSDANTAATLEFQPTYASLDDGLYP